MSEGCSSAEREISIGRISWQLTRLARIGTRCHAGCRLGQKVSESWRPGLHTPSAFPKQSIVIVEPDFDRVESLSALYLTIKAVSYYY